MKDDCIQCNHHRTEHSSIANTCLSMKCTCPKFVGFEEVEKDLIEIEHLSVQKLITKKLLKQLDTYRTITYEVRASVENHWLYLQSIGLITDTQRASLIEKISDVPLVGTTSSTGIVER